MVLYAVTTHPGLEDLLVEEIAHRLSIDIKSVDRAPGRALVDLPASAQSTLLTLRSAHHVTVGVARQTIEHPITLVAIQSILKEISVPGLAAAPSFRVRSVRTGQHDFNSMALERAAGAVFHLASGVKVDLESPAVTIRVDLTDNVLWVGILLTDRPLSRRAKVYAQKIGLSADLAFAAVFVADLEEPERILDPFCGSGTLLLEAGALHPRAELWGSDWVEGAVQGTRTNLTAADFDQRAHLRTLDANRMASEYPSASFDAIVSNPPFGLKMGARVNFYRFYQRLLEQADVLLKPYGRLVLWLHRRGQFQAAVKAHGGFEVYRTIGVQTGSARPVLVGLRRPLPV